jgi:hypothetical protein
VHHCLWTGGDVCCPDSAGTHRFPPPTTAPAATHTPAPTEAPTEPLESEPDPSTELNPETGLPPGDAERGYRIAASTFNCYGCHVYEGDTVAAPPFAADGELPFILERGEQRIASPDYTGEATTSMAYFIESVFQPEVYLVPGEWPNEMSTVYRKIMTDQDLADIIAWVITLEQAAP